MRIFSGIQPTGEKHLGNLIGGFRQYAATQEQGDAFFCIVDLHSITTDYEPADLHSRTLDLYAMLVATGLDPERSTVFAQSHVTAHAEAAWLLSAVTSYGQLGRMTQFKDKSDQQDFVSAGLFTYPVLMAGDILLYQADIVPIGDDQRQHLELARDVAERFNSRFGETFVVPRGVYPEVGARIMDLQEPTRKMSTTGGTPQGTVGLLDPPDVIRKKFRSAVTDSGREVRRADDKPGVSNLIDILSVASGRAPAEIEAQYGDGGYGQFKQDVGEAVVELLAPVQERYAELARRRGRAPAAARARRREGTRRVGADARAHVRGGWASSACEADGDRRGGCASRSSSSPASCTTPTRRRSPSSSSRGPRSAASPGRSGSRPSRSARGSARPSPACCSRRSATCRSSSSSSSRSAPASSSWRSSRSSARCSRTRCSCSGSRSPSVPRSADGRRDALPQAAAERHGDAAAALGLPDRAARAVGSGRRPRQRAPGRDLGRRRDLPARRLRAPGSSATSAPTSRREHAPVEPAHAVLPFPWALALLATAGVSAALVSEWFVDAIDPAVEKLGISKAFTGLVIVAIAGNAVENVVAVQLARKGQSDLAISVVKNSVAQIACFLFPALVLISLLFTEQLTFVINPVFIGALALTAIAVWQITGDGEAVLFEGLALVALYVVLATLVWFE